MTKSTMTTIFHSVMNCSYCQPLSGCVLSDLKGKQKEELKSHLSSLSENALSRMVSYHDSCPYKNRLAI